MKVLIKEFISFVPLSLIKMLTVLLRVKINIILVYHHVAELNHKYSDFIEHSHNVYPEIFNEQINYLYNTKIPFIDLAQVANESNIKYGISISITFDDNTKSVYTNAFPILKERGLPFTIFIITSLLEGRLFWRDVIYHVINTSSIDLFLTPLIGKVPKTNLDKLSYNLRQYSKDPDVYNFDIFPGLIKSYIKQKDLDETELANELYLNEQELREMANYGAKYGNHTSSHPVLSCLGKKQIEKEFMEGHNFLISKGFMAKNELYFSLPFGCREDYSSAYLEDLAKEKDYKMFLVSDWNVNKPQDNIFINGRMMASHSVKEFKIRLKFVLLRKLFFKCKDRLRV